VQSFVNKTKIIYNAEWLEDPDERFVYFRNFMRDLSIFVLSFVQSKHLISELGGGGEGERRKKRLFQPST
jgi:hypothetical protein